MAENYLIVRCDNRDQYVTLLAMVFSLDGRFHYNSPDAGLIDCRDPQEIFEARAREFPWLIIYGPEHPERAGAETGVITGHRKGPEFDSTNFSNLTLTKLCKFLGFYQASGSKGVPKKVKPTIRKPDQGNRFSMIKAQRARA